MTWIHLALNFQAITTTEQLSSLWRLHQSTFKTTVFNSPAWLMNWLEHYWLPQWQLCCYAIFDQEKLISFAPFYIQPKKHRFGLSILYPLGQGEPEQSEVASEFIDILILSGYEKSVIALLEIELKTLRIDQILWRANLENSHINKLLTLYKNNANANNFTRFIVKKDGWALNLLSKNNRSRYKRSLNQLKKINADFCWVAPENYQKYFNILAQYHQIRWHKQDKLGAFTEQNFTDFHHGLMQPKTVNMVKMTAVIIQDIPVAINYYLVDDNTLYFYQCGWDITRYAKLSLGLALHIWTIEHSPLKYYDFMMGDNQDSYKAKFGAVTYPMKNLDVRIKPWRVKLNKFVDKLLQHQN